LQKSSCLEIDRAPMTYSYRGKQYIVIAVSTRQHPAELVALAFPDGNTPRAVETATPASIAERNVNRGSITKSMQDQLDNGRAIYGQYCAACHGAKGEGAPEGAPPLSGQTNVDLIIERVKKAAYKCLRCRQCSTTSRFWMSSLSSASSNALDRDVGDGSDVGKSVFWPSSLTSPSSPPSLDCYTPRLPVPAIAPMNLYQDLQFRGIVKQVTDPELEQALAAGPMTLYVGFDPTADSLHVGSLRRS
jgi:cytochrome c553